MTLVQWFIFFLAVQVVHFAGTWKLYEKAGHKPWEAAVPVYNAVVLMKIINRPWYWTILLFIPVVNVIMFPVIWVQILKAFGKNTTTDYIIGILTCGLYIYALNYSGKADYKGTSEHTESTLSSLLFAVVVATIVHTYVIQPFTIPSASLEKTLLIGDFLFVSKVHYGARVPETALAAPMVHDTIPLVGVKSYSKWPQLPYFRLPGFAKPQKNDIVVFNWPADTVHKFFEQGVPGVRKPVDKKSNYVKRCVATPGDVFELKDGIVYINGSELKLSDRAKVQYYFDVEAKQPIAQEFLANRGYNGGAWRFYNIALSKWDNNIIKEHINELNEQYNVFINEASRDSVNAQVWGFIPEQIATELQMTPIQNRMAVNMTFANADELRKDQGITHVNKTIYTPFTQPKVFPKNNAKWTADNMGPITIPQKGQTVQLTTETLPFYKRIISEYENNELKVTGNEIRINGTPVTSYTIKQNYYFMMGDNRHNSEDSRYWGFVPEDHIVGKPVLIWLSLDQNQPWGNIGKKIRWDRMFTTVGGDGEPVSYFRYFIIALIGYFALDFFVLKKRKAQNS
ncbi:signal peptidase I [Flavobacterium sp. RHBU_3]|uniref:signal peptidase I n=1 Tax=Flavobacterium sp. RHBU_3 TaxID=3391184 RepID=UPI003984F96E